MATLDFLNNISETFKTLAQGLQKREEVSLGIDIGSSSVKVVQLKKESGKVVLQTYGEVTTGPYAEKMAGEMPVLSSEVMATAIQDVVKASNATAKNISLSLQARASLLFVLTLPKVSNSELQQIIPHEARKYIPVPLSEISLDWWPIQSQEYIDNPEQQKNQDVLVVAIRKETIQEYNDLIKSAGLVPDVLEVEVFSAIRSTFRHELQPVLLVDLGASSTRVAIVEYGVVRTFHTITRGSHALTIALATSLNVSFEKAEQIKKQQGLSGQDEQITRIIDTSLTFTIAEIKNALLHYEKESQKTIGKVILIGGGARLSGLVDRMSREFQTPIALGDPFQKTDYPEFLSNVLKDSGPEFAIAVGLALKKLGAE